MSEIKQEMKAENNLNDTYDLMYKDQQVEENTALFDNEFEEDFPLYLRPKRTKQLTHNGINGQIPEPSDTSHNVNRRSGKTSHHDKTLGFGFDEPIEDTTESVNKPYDTSAEKYQWNPPNRSRRLSAPTVEHDPCLNPSHSKLQSSAHKIPPLDYVIDETNLERTLSSLSARDHKTLHKACPVDKTLTERSIEIVIDEQLPTARSNIPNKTSKQEYLQNTKQNTYLLKKNILDDIELSEIEEDLPHQAHNSKTAQVSNTASQCSSSSNNRISSPDYPNYNCRTSIINRDILRQNNPSSNTTIHLQTITNTHIFHLSTTATLKQFFHVAKQKILSHDYSQKYNYRTHTLLYFNYRMHIFKNTDIENEHLTTFLTLKTSQNKTNPSIPTDFFVQLLQKDLVEKMYVYEKDPTIIFQDSIWWQSHSHTEQTPLSQSTLLSTLYVLYQYFRRPPVNEKASRRALEIQFLLYLRRYLFPPAFQALKHMLIRQMFAFEKAVLVDGLLHLLAQFCPSSVDKNLMGLYTPHLFCWLFERSQREMETQDGFVMFQLRRYPNNSIPHYINDPVTIHDLNHDRDVLYEHQEAERYKNITRNVDLYSLIKHLQNPMLKDIIDIDNYTIDMWGCHELELIDCLKEDDMCTHVKVMSRVYRSFTLLVHNALENSDVRDQLILVSNKQVGICFKRRQRLKADGRIDNDLECFIPVDPTQSGIITLNSSDIYEVELGRPDPRIPSALRSNLPMMPKLRVQCSPIEQITVILFDI